eukprot:1147529-Pelagomonas_calceolata.AAC.1
MVKGEKAKSLASKLSCHAIQRLTNITNTRHALRCQGASGEEFAGHVALESRRRRVRVSRSMADNPPHEPYGTGREGADWNLQPPHVCRGEWGSKMVLKWNPERAKEYAEVLANNKEIQEQFQQISVCAPLRTGRIGSRYPPWFDAVCKQKRKIFREAVQSGQAEHACKFARKQFRATARRAKRAYTKRQKAKLLGRLYCKDPELHVMLRQPKRAQITPLAEPAWVAYLNEHF